MKSTKVGYKVYRVEFNGKLYEIDGAEDAPLWTLYVFDNDGLHEFVDYFETKRAALVWVEFHQ